MVNDFLLDGIDMQNIQNDKTRLSFYQFFIASAIFLSVLIGAATAVKADQPNIILILTDDQGWADLSVGMDNRLDNAGSDYYETPNIEKLAQQSMVFSSGYAPSPICTPTRASLLTGKSPQKLGFTDIIDSKPGSRRFSDLYAGKALIGPLPKTGLPYEEITIAEFLKNNVPGDYATAHFGKWHLGSGGPGQHGFDAHDGSTANNGVVANSEDPNPKDMFGITGRAVAFMREQVKSGRPFYLQLSHYANHIPILANEDTIRKYKNKPKGVKHDNALYAAMSEDLDQSVGRLLSAIDQLGLGKNTYIFYMSDNGGSINLKGPSTNNKPLRAGKTWVYEGGVRVPFMISGPGVEVGQTNTPVIGWDIFPTICDIVSCPSPLPEGIEGGSLFALMQGKSNKVDRPRGDMLVWHFPHYLTIKGTTPLSAMRIGKYKYVRDYHRNSASLFDLETDIGENNDLSEQLPAVVKDMEEALTRYLRDVEAPMPVPNEFASPSSTR